MKLKIRENVLTYGGTRIFTAGMKYSFHMCPDGWETVGDNGNTQYLTLAQLNSITDGVIE